MNPANEAKISEQGKARNRVPSADERELEKSDPDRGAPLFASPWLALMIILRKEFMAPRRKH